MDLPLFHATIPPMQQQTPFYIASTLTKHSAQPACFVAPTPKVMDFTSREASSSCGATLVSAAGSDLVPLGDEWSARMFCHSLRLTLLDGDRRLYAWDWKTLSSFLLGRHGVSLVPSNSLVDLKLLESMGDVRRACPESAGEFLSRLKSAMSHPGWRDFQPVYRRVYCPMSTVALPELESAGILADDRLHAHYELAGQDNGRLLCHKAFERGYNPHVITPEQKSSYKPLGLDHVFVSFDYSGMEAAMLAWLSEDAGLARMCSSGDLYRSVYEELTRTPCDAPEKRSMCKSFLLPMFYGMGVRAVSERTGLPEVACESLRERLRSSFGVAWGFVEDAQSSAESGGSVTDRFGKTRFMPDRFYRARNFAVQSPAAVFCMDGLLRLRESLNGMGKVLYNVHDGYVASVPRDRARDALLAGKEALESESHLFPGLSIGVTCSAGRSLADMKRLNVPRKNR